MHASKTNVISREDSFKTLMDRGFPHPLGGTRDCFSQASVRGQAKRSVRRPQRLQAAYPKGYRRFLLSCDLFPGSEQVEPQAAGHTCSRRSKDCISYSVHFGDPNERRFDYLSTR